VCRIAVVKVKILQANFREDLFSGNPVNSGNLPSYYSVGSPRGNLAADLPLPLVGV
jgi:hypothetical protein